MTSRNVTMPELALIAGTRGMLGAGIGLLMAGKLDDGRRRLLGRVLFLVGAVTTIPLALEVLGRRPTARPEVSPDY